ncbi:MAG: 4Fe-4S binding protein, partial [Promethearchaeota archaeon]
DNGWIGMTGQQPHPGSDTHYYKEGNFKKRINLENFLRGTGADIDVIKHYQNEDKNYPSRLKDLIYEKGIDVLKNKDLHVIVIQDECIQKIVKREKTVIRFVNIESCNNCGICYNQFLCPAMGEQNNSAYIDPDLCLGCGVCEEICPNNAISREEL